MSCLGGSSKCLGIMWSW